MIVSISSSSSSSSMDDEKLYIYAKTRTMRGLFSQLKGDAHQLEAHAEVMLGLGHPRVEHALRQMHHRVQAQRCEATHTLKPHDAHLLKCGAIARPGREVRPERVSVKRRAPQHVVRHLLVAALHRIVTQAECAQVLGAESGRVWAQKLGGLRLEPPVAEVLELVLRRVPRALPHLAREEHEERRAHAVAVPLGAEAEAQLRLCLIIIFEHGEESHRTVVAGAAIVRRCARVGLERKSGGHFFDCDANPNASCEYILGLSKKTRARPFHSRIRKPN